MIEQKLKLEKELFNVLRLESSNLLSLVEKLRKAKWMQESEKTNLDFEIKTLVDRIQE